MKSFLLLILSFLVSPIMSFGTNKRIVFEAKSSNAVLGPKDFSEKNVTYVLKSAFSLNSKTVYLKEKSIIEFEGGSLNNGTLVLNSNSSVKGILNNVVCGVDLKVQVSGHKVKLSNLYWSNSKGCALLSYSDCDELCIENCTISSPADNCVKLVADHINGVVQGVEINNSFFTFKRMGVEIQNHGNGQYKYDGIVIQNCKFSLVDSFPKYGYAVSLSGYGKNVVIKDNQFVRSVTGVEVVGFSNVLITNNTFQDISSKVIVSSGKRKMENVDVDANYIQCTSAKIQMSNTRNASIKNNSMDLLYIEMIGCSGCKIEYNTIKSSGHYSLIFDGGKNDTVNNKIANNRISQGKENWAVFRCYGQKCKNNQFLNNTVSRASRKGVIFDQLKGASKNLID